MLALACQYAVIPVPDFPQAYRPRPDESAADHLCGLWQVGTSTFYRYLDKGKRQLVDLLFEPPLQGERALARDALLQHEVYALLQLVDAPIRTAWHRATGAARAERHARRARRAVAHDARR